MELITLAIGPGIAICLFIIHRDAFNREPKLNLLLAFVFGAITVFPAALIEQNLQPYTDKSITGTAIFAFLVVALTEELLKFLVLVFYAYPRKSFDEPLDGIVYSVMISMGFASLENYFYIEKFGMQVGFYRMFLAIPAHATFAVLMGYYAGKAKFDANKSSNWLLKGLLWAVIFHGLYDFFLFLQETPGINEFVSNGLLFLGAVASLIVGLVLSLKHIRVHRRLSQQSAIPMNNLALRKAYPADIPIIMDLTQKIWPSTYSGILSNEQIDYMLEQTYTSSSLHKQMENGHQFALIYDGVEAVGFTSVSQAQTGIIKLEKIYVLPSQQGKGTGRFAIQQLMQSMKSAGINTLQLNVNRHNKAKEFYEKMGFAVIRTEDIDIGNGYFMNDYVMEKKLNS